MSEMSKDEGMYFAQIQKDRVGNIRVLNGSGIEDDKMNVNFG